MRHELKRLRQRRGLTVDELSAKANVDRSTVYRLERGDTEPTLPVARRLAAVLNVPVGSLSFSGEAGR